MPPRLRVSVCRSPLRLPRAIGCAGPRRLRQPPGFNGFAYPPAPANHTPTVGWAQHRILDAGLRPAWQGGMYAWAAAAVVVVGE